jgi:hypothetical protein
MSSLSAVRLVMKSDLSIRKMMVRGNRNEILLDMDGDGQPDVAIQDINNDGQVDRIAFDVSGSGTYDLFVDDQDGNGIPDRIFTFTEGGEEGRDKEEVLAEGPALEVALVESYKGLVALMDLQEMVKEDLDAALKELEINVRKARRELR